MSTVPGVHARARNPQLEEDEGRDSEGTRAPHGEHPESGSTNEASEPPALEDTARTRGIVSGARIQAAASAAFDGHLSELLRAMQTTSSRVEGARETNEQLVHELHALRELLLQESGALVDEVQSLGRERERMRLEIERVTRAAAEDRAFLLEEQDRFLSGVLDDHEQALHRITAERDAARAQLAAAGNDSPLNFDDETGSLDVNTLHRKLHEASVAKDKLLQEHERARDTLRRLQAQRDEAQDQVKRLTLERDKAHSELFALQAERSSNQRTIPQTRPPTTYPPPGQMLQAHAIVGRRTDPMGAALPLADNVSDPVVEMRYPDQRSAPLKQKPSPSLTPLGAYSLAAEELPPDGVDIAADKPDRS
ncbi:MAG TPA: hypothetical protein VK524_15720 [Polyangiaceae bacterium]|nr:hypothetical protein [Polyangiaceae bacterium]